MCLFHLGTHIPVGFVGECLDDQILILVSPVAHLRVRVDDRGDILDNVLLLSSFIMKGHLKRRRGLQSSSDVDFGSTCDTYMKIWEGKFDELLHETEDQVPRRWQSKSVGTLVERVHNNVDRAVIGKRECVLQALYQHVISGLVCAIVMSLIYAVEYIAANIGASGKLREEGKEQVSPILFLSIPEVEVKVCHGGESSIAQNHEILDDAELADNLVYLKQRYMGNSAPKDALPGARYSDKSRQSGTGKGWMTYASHGSTAANR
jgi:hypothetical protein